MSPASTLGLHVDNIELDVLIDSRSGLAASGVPDGPHDAKLSGRGGLGRGVWCLLIQHASSMLTAAAFDFALFLFISHAYPNSLAPPAVAGLCMALSSTLFSGHMGQIVDGTPRLPLVRRVVFVQKALITTTLVFFMVLFSLQAGDAGEQPARTATATFTVGAVYVAIVLCSSAAGLAKTCMTVAIERDWVTVMAAADGALLTALNANMRRIDLVCKLCAPLVVSFGTAALGYTWSTFALAALAVLTAVAEVLWIRIVYAHFSSVLDATDGAIAIIALETRSSRATHDQPRRTISARLKASIVEWHEFARLPVFYSSVAMALLHLTTLSYDGIFIAYIQSSQAHQEAFIGIMRSLCVVTGLLGTVLMPFLEARLGLVRAAAWSLWSELVCLVFPVLALFSASAAARATYSAAWPVPTRVALFGGVVLSRVGLWSFDLCQTKEIQQALDGHPRRNALAARQLALQSAFDLAKYVLALAIGNPAQFRWTALVSWLAVGAGAVAPVDVPALALPTSFVRRITVSGPTPPPRDDRRDDEIIGLPVSAFSSTSKHPFADSSSSSSSASAGPFASTSGSSSSSSAPSFTPTVHPTSLPTPPEASHVQPFKHPFDTHAFVTHLEDAGLAGTSRTLMEATREVIVRRAERARERMISKEDMDNEAYLFRAALSELRTELSVRTRNDGITLRAMSGAIRREVDGLEQKMKEDIQTLKHDIEMDMNNRKAETRTEMKSFDISIEEINNKFTISLGDLRTELESAKWDATRRAISIIVFVVIIGVGVSTVSIGGGADEAKPEVPAASAGTAAAATTATMRDMAVGTDDDEPFGDTEAKLDQLLQRMERPKPERRESRPRVVERI
ncbi:hypothetical protein Q5752_005255 [Cryptotrichosporon argae]